jgi:hypothetical protein
MVRRIKLAGLVAALVAMFLPYLTLAQGVSFGVSPAVVRIDNLLPGEATVFNLTIRNKDEIAHNFTTATFHPPKKQREKGRAAFPDVSWISFDPDQIEVPAQSVANVTVTVAIPPEQKWAGEHWEAWLGVAAESSDLLGVRARLDVRLLVSTGGARSNVRLVAGIAVAIALLGCGGYYYFRRKARPE